MLSNAQRKSQHKLIRIQVIVCVLDIYKSLWKQVHPVASCGFYLPRFTGTQFARGWLGFHWVSPVVSVIGNQSRTTSVALIAVREEGRMSNKKMTLLGHPARKKLNTFLRHHSNQVTRTSRRLAWVEGVMAISGGDGITLAQNQYGVNIADMELQARFFAMLQSYNFQDLEHFRQADVCAEAHLWMTLVGLSASYHNTGQPPRHRAQHPRHLHMWVYQINKKNSVKEDSPCENCRQWARLEFSSVNGTS